MNLFAIFLTGLTVGGLSCLAVQGGLLASVISVRKKEDEKVSNKWFNLFATGSFLIAKLVAYTILGILLGAFGSSISISNNVQTTMQLVAGIYMLAVALNLLNAHPIFRYAIIQPPRFLTKLIKNQSHSKEFFAPAVLGAMTIFIPCGTTLAMEALAISSASAVSGGLLMAVFILGTVPLFIGMGVLTSVLGESFKNKFFKVAALLLIYIGLVSIHGGLVALGVSTPFLDIASKQPVSENRIGDVPVSQNVVIEIMSQGYSPDYIKVKSGQPVTLKVINKDSYSCAAAFRIPSLGVSFNLRPTQEEIVTFTPQKKGKIPFSCSMGMYRGVIEVI